MNIQEALKQIKAEKPKENYLIIEWNYDCKIVLPHKDGLVFINSMASAEKLNSSYHSQQGIFPMEEGILKVSNLSAEDYGLYKVAALLKMSYEEIKNQIKAQ